MNQASRTRPLVEGERFSFPHVGGRRYVRGLDVVALIERRYPDFARLDLKFLRPIAHHAAISFRRDHGTAVVVSLAPTEGAPLDLYIVNLDKAEGPSGKEPRLAPHIALPGSGAYHRYLVLGRRSHAEILAVVFNRYQAATGRRFVLRALHLEPPRAASIELVSLTEPTTERGLGVCSITRQGRRWCRIEMIEAQASGVTSTT
ncbi:hypothetical protein CK222_17125 [Mesorhizobium sp. WSM3866]|uniref:hypothetical protein n=1 Tax=Mesorhizobium sp. WSM3866 TaxID=422271 RepID=UPI000BB07164|nr:hypothetical protein [Mesorhizobium sp. WSM3866]PBB42223.1 hypothetical protein CK222_17125 [Mesorhizobium sp. WSM3866]